MMGTVEPDVVDLLLAQHTEIEGLFGAVLTALGERKRELFQELVRLLAVHEAAEEELIHPRVRVEVTAADPVVEQRLREEQDAKRKLADLYDLGVEHVDFDRGLTELARDVLEHAAQEEQEEFPNLRVGPPLAVFDRVRDAIRDASTDR